MSRLHTSQLRRAVTATVIGALGATLMLVAPTAAAADTPAAPPEELGVRINEVVSSGGIPDDWIEFYNYSDAPVDLSGYIVQDNSTKNPYTIPAGTVLGSGEYYVLDTLSSTGEGHFDFGLGKGDSVRLFAPGDANGETPVLQTTWPAGTHATPSWGVREDGTWAMTAVATKGAANIFEDEGEAGEPAPTPGSVVLNEVDSQPADWVELYNPGSEPFDLTGYELRDNADDPDHRWAFLEGTLIGAGEFLLVEQGDIGVTEGVETEFGVFGIGSADEIRLFKGDELVDRTGAWTSHAAINGDFAAATYARCIDGDINSPFELAYATPGEPNRCVPPAVAINEIDSKGTPDWAEIVNTGTEPIDISGWTLMDNDPAGHAADVIPLPQGTILEPGEYFVFNGTDHFTFGLGNGDTVTIRNAQGITVAEHVYDSHATGVWARCEDGTGEFVDVEVSTPGMRNACGNPIRINEVESSGGEPGDWIELYNPTSSALDISGIVVKDNDDSHAYTVPEGTTVAAEGFFVLEEADFGFGLGSGDSVRLFDGDQLIDSTTWPTGHADPTWGRCPTGTGPFAETAESTKGAPNTCVGEISVQVWPGSADVRVLDETPTFLVDSSGLDTQETADGTFLWLVDNGTGRIWKFAASADGSVTPAEGWTDGKRVRFQRDADNPRAAGPDAEGITVDDAGNVYVVAERDNSAKNVNQNTILMVNPNEDAQDLIAIAEWDITALLPQVGANLGAEAIEWVPNAALAGQLWDDNTQAPYVAGDYAGDGLFFVAVEDGGGVFALALGADSATLVATLDPGLPGVMALDYDTALGVLWAMCDDGCDGKTAQLTLNGTDTPTVAHFARPAGLPNINNEGFATAPASLSTDGQRPVWWFADGYSSQSLRVGTLPGGLVGGGDGEPGVTEPGGSTPGEVTPPDGSQTGQTPAGTGSDPLGTGPGTDAGSGSALADTGAQGMSAALGLGALLLIGGVFLGALRRFAGRTAE